MFTALIARIKTEPAFVLALLAAVVQALEAQDALTWSTFGTVVLGVVIRQLVTPASVVEAEVDAAAEAGYSIGRNIENLPQPGEFE